MKKITALVAVLVALGCARVNLQTEKPLKVDINMRVDVYQHVVKEAASIEDQVYGSSEKKLNLLLRMDEAYAQESGSDLDNAIQLRRARASTIEGYFDKGYVGENKDALLELKDQSLASDLSTAVQSMIAEENRDRDIIYKATAQKNSADLARTRQIFFDDHYKRASSGWWFQVHDSATGTYNWVRK